MQFRTPTLRSLGASLGFRVQSLLFFFFFFYGTFSGLGFRIYALGLGVWALGFRL